MLREAVNRFRAEKNMVREAREKGATWESKKEKTIEKEISRCRMEEQKTEKGSERFLREEKHRIRFMQRWGHNTLTKDEVNDWKLLRELVTKMKSFARLI